MSLKLEEWRRLKKYSIRELADKCDVHFNTYMRWKKHPERIPIKYAKRLAEVFGVPIESIVFEVEVEESRKNA